MRKTDQALLALLRLGIGTASETDPEMLWPLTFEEWKEVMIMATEQGVAAVAIDGLQRLFQIDEDRLAARKESPTEWTMWVIENVGNLTMYEQRNAQQRQSIKEVAALFHQHGIKMMVFKGQANASLYPNPAHRAPGDIDCYLFGDAEKGDELLKAQGAQIDNRWYRHSKISFKGETIENHRVMGHTRGSKKKKEMEETFKRLSLDSAACEEFGGVQIPSPQFNAVFLTYHGLHHFLSEGLRLKQILDWALFLREKQNQVNWDKFNTFCIQYGLDRFAAVMNYIAVGYLGVRVSENCIVQDGKYADKILQSTLHDDDYLFNCGKSDWMVRWLLVKNMLGRDRWKYEDVAQENVWKHLWGNAKGFFFGGEE